MMDPEQMSDEKVQRAALEWLREAFGLPEAQWVKGVPEDGSRCAIAQVLLTGGYADPEVDNACITAFRPDWGGEFVHRVPPPLVAEFIDRFDRGCYPDLLVVDEWAEEEAVA